MKNKNGGTRSGAEFDEKCFTNRFIKSSGEINAMEIVRRDAQRAPRRTSSVGNTVAVVRREERRGTREIERDTEGVVTRVGLFAGWPELIITDGYQPVNSDTPLRASPAALSVSLCASNWSHGEISNPPHDRCRRRPRFATAAPA